MPSPDFVHVDIYAGADEQGDWYVTVESSNGELLIQYGPFDQQQALEVHHQVFEKSRRLAEKLGGHVVQEPKKRLDA